MTRFQDSDGVWHYFLSGKEVTEEEYLGQLPGGTPAGGSAWPMLSEALAVHPEDIPEAKAFYKKRGLDVDFSKDGRVVMRDRAHRRKVIKANGSFDKDGGYGDG